MKTVCLIASSEEHWGNQWGYVLSHCQPDRLYNVGDFDRSIKPFKHAIQIDSAAELPDDGPIFHITPAGKTPITAFIHPGVSTYIFGPDDRNVSKELHGARIADTVRIDTDNDLEMYSWVAGAIILHDRRMMDGG